MRPTGMHRFGGVAALRHHTISPQRLSRLYVPTVSADALGSLDTLESVRRLLRGGYIRQSASGTYTYLPIGLRMLKKLTAIIEDEMHQISASQLELPQLLSPALWHKTGRFEAMGSELFRLKDRRGNDMILAPTHEEEITKLVGMEIDSAKSLPVRVFQIGRKFRDEPRPRAGLLRTKEFLMKDMYSFDVSVEDARTTYEDVLCAYERIFQRVFCWDQARSSETTWMRATADSGTMGGKLSHEFHVPDPAGEDTLLSCDQCSYTSNVECAKSLGRGTKEEEQGHQHGRDETVTNAARAGDRCASCTHGTLREHKAIEVGHTFLLGTRYSEALGYHVVPRHADPKRPERVPLQMGCYGIGITRVLGALAQRAAREFDAWHAATAQTSSMPLQRRRPQRVGFFWPCEIAPFRALVLPSTPQHMDIAMRLCTQLDGGLAVTWADGMQELLHVPNEDVALDDRTHQSLGSRLFDSDLMGYPIVLVLGKHYDQTGEVEVRQAGQPVRYAKCHVTS